MTKTVQRFLNLLLLVFFAAGLLFPSQVFAESYDCDVSIPVTMQVIGNTSKDSYQVVIEAADEASAAFMPTTGSLFLKNGETKTFGPIHYTETGDFHYTIYQKSGTQSDMIYDTTIFHATVRVSNKGDYASDGLEAQLWVNRNASTEKTDKIVFKNTQKTKPVVTPTVKRTYTPSRTSTYVLKSSTSSNSADPVKTGDNTNLIVWIVLVSASAAVIFVSVIMKRRKRYK